MNAVFNVDAGDFLDAVPKAQMVFMDGPDNLGLQYDQYKDKIPDAVFYAWMESLILKSMLKAPCVWVSYYYKHDLEIKYLVRQILRARHPTFEAKTFVWRYTFGQHNQSDCGSGFRFLLRLLRSGTPLYPGQIRVESERQRSGDSRAAPEGRVPDDFWCFDVPRVTGNSAERRSFHPTQHPERLMERVIGLSTKPGDLILDPFAGTGTTLRVAKRLGRLCMTSEISANYASLVADENGVLCYTDFEILKAIPGAI